jgi:Reverse transcriptase-like
VATNQKTIYPGTVLPPVTSTGLHVTFSRPGHPASDKISQGKLIVSHGTVFQDVNKVHRVNEANTGVPYAVQSPTTPSNVTLINNLLIVNTPFIPDEWEMMLSKTPLFNNFRDVPIGIRVGFDMGVDSTPSYTYTPPNHNSALLYPDHVLSHIHKELSLHRYSGPFSSSRLEYLIGPFRTSPLGTVPKPDSSTERRIVQDLSFPRNDPSFSSVNDGINIEDFRCDWGTFNDVRNIVIDAPEKTEATTLDVDSAFRCCPISPSQQSNFVIHWNDLFYIDHNAPFGATSSGGVFGRLADALTNILSSKGIGPSKNWVDDFVFFRYPMSNEPNNLSFAYSLSDIYDVATRLGWPWKDSKTKPFANEFKYLSFIWNLSTKTVQIPLPKKLRYLSKLEPWTSDQKFSKKDAESILGTLVHCSLAVPDGRSHLPSISRFTSSFNYSSSSFIRKSPNTSLLSDIKWWRSQLSLDFCGSSLSKPPITSSIEFWVDASSSWGIGIILNNEWDAWKLLLGWDKNGRNIGWAEIVAIELGLLFAIHRGYSDTHFLIKSDNQGVIQAIEGGKSRSPEQNAVLQRITSLLSSHKLWISSLYIPSIENLADRPSRGLPALNRSRADTTFALPAILRPLFVPNTYVD